MNKRIRRKRVRQMLLVELAVLFKDPADAIVWLETPLDDFEGRTPRQTIASGEVERVTLLLDELNTAAQQKRAGLAGTQAVSVAADPGLEPPWRGDRSLHRTR